MKFGAFLPTTNNGYILSTASPQFMPTFELIKDVTVTAERCGFDYVLSMAKFRGYGADGDGFWDYATDPLAVMGALIGATSTIGLWGSIGLPTIHPAVAARMAATYDDASGGRFAMNIVAGWNKAEYDQMGLWPSDDYYSKRYSYVNEYVEVLRGLWADGRLTHHGANFDLEDCLVQPRPPHGVPIMIPGQSASSIELAAERADVNFVTGSFDVVAQARRDLVAATAVTGREVGTSALYGVITAPTDEEALAQLKTFSDATDVTAFTNLGVAASGDTVGLAATRYIEPQAIEIDVTFEHPTRAEVVQGPCLFHPHLVGSYERVAAFLADLESEAGVDRVCLSFPDYRADVAGFAQNVIPRVEALLAASPAVAPEVVPA
ncbi:LLM class flavin-dependent oxidoreductase [Frondihabitans cladoniiphilus]|uniref:Pyrimidine utilization protein A n=1 Tax=Frondihabitans cladoniiphilus TaxID=715785 RepID=A0ABP8VU65_9MICO